jgi:hypothetical protein
MGLGPKRRRRGGGGAGLLLGSLLLAGAALGAPRDQIKRPDFATVLTQTLAGRKFIRAGGPDQAAAAAMFDHLSRGDYSLPALIAVPDLARLDRVVAEACPGAKPPSQLVKDSTPFLLTGQFDAKTVPPGAAITVSAPAYATLALPASRFLIYTITLTGARVAPAPIIEARGINLGDCHASGDALSLVDGTTTDATITGQGLVLIGGEPVWVVTARAERQVGVTLQPLDRRLKNYQVDDGWKFLSAP